MKNKIALRRPARLTIVLLLFLLVIILTLIFIYQNGRAIESKPLVLIHSPLNREPFQVGEIVAVHATARCEKALSSVELWVNNIFVDAHKASGEDTVNSLVLSSSWLATNVGSNVIIVRATSTDGTEGQASIVINVSESEGEAEGLHTVRQGDTLRSIAGEYGLDPDLLELANPDLDLDELDPGDEIIIPEDIEEPPAEVDPPDDDPPADDPPLDDPPFPEGAAPGSGFLMPGVIDDYILGPAQDFLLRPAQDYIFDLLGTERIDDRARLQLELLSLTTSAPFEQLYLYVSYGDFPQHRFPDEHDDLGIGESIHILSTDADGTTRWDISSVAGNVMPLFSWPHNQSLPFSFSLVGVLESGTDSVELYYFMDPIPPELWTGMPLSGGADDGDYSFEFSFRIAPAEGGERGVPLYTDINMTPPENARLDDRNQSLRWDYNPRPDEEPIDGFRIYLNSGLQWVEPARARESMLPTEWLNPPCGTTYVFSVTAYRIGIPDGPESLPSIARLQSEVANCQREIEITFLELETFNLGGDGRRPPHRGDVGPVYGYFFANNQRIQFNTNPTRGWNRGSPDLPDGFYHHTLYDLAELAANPDWHFSGRPTLLVEIPDDGSFQFGFHFMDEDYGRCRRPSDAGCDDLIAEASSPVYSLTSTAGRERFDRQNEGVLVADNGRCQVSYVWGPAFGSPVGSGVEGWEPLPLIYLERFEVDDSGLVSLHVRNIGTATWPWRDLKVELQNRDGSSIGVYTWPNFALEPGQRTVLEQTSMRLDPPYDACVLIDPYNDVLQEGDLTGGRITSIPVCQPAPDLVINDVGFVPGEGTGQLAITITNMGQGPLTNRTVSFEANAMFSGMLDLGGAEAASAHNVTLGRFETATLLIGEISSPTRLQMHEGYTVRVDPENLIYELNTDNNTFDVPAGGELEIVLTGVEAPFSMRNKSIDYEFTASVISGYGHDRNVVLYQLVSNPDWTLCNYHGGCRKSLSHASGRFLIFGDESLEVTVNVSRGRDSWISNFIYLPRHTWGADNNLPTRFGSGHVEVYDIIPTRWHVHKFFISRQSRYDVITTTFKISCIIDGESR